MRSKLLVTALTGQLLSALSFAQTAEDAVRIEAPIIVTGPGPDRTSDELIGNATVLDRGELVARLAASLGDTLDAEPGVASTFFGPGASRPILRGLGSERVQVLTNGIGVIDVSAASPDHQVTADAIDAEKVEILRGPAALAYGGQAIGGVVNVIDGLIADTMPERTTSGDVYGAYATADDGLDAAGRATVAVGPFVATLRATQRDLNDYEIPGFVESSALRAKEGETGGTPEKRLPNSFVSTQSLSAGLSYIGDRGFVGVGVRQQTAEYGIPGGHGEEEEEEGGEEERPFIDLEQNRLDFRAGLYAGTGIFRGANLGLSYADYAHTEFEAPGVAGTVFEVEGLEGRIETNYGMYGVDVALGLQYLDKELDAAGDEAFITLTDTRALSAFAYAVREFAGGLGLEGGARFEQVEVKNVSGRSADFDLISGAAGVHQHFTNRWFAGLQASYTERAPNESELFAFGPHLATRQFEVGNPALEKERGLNIEGTLRWRGDRISVGGNFFTTEFRDFIYLTPGAITQGGLPVTEKDGLPVFVFVQEDASFVGGEVYTEAAFEGGPLGADWTVRASIDVVEAELDSGKDVPFVPPVGINAMTKADWGRLELGTSIVWADSQDAVGEGQLPTDSYTLLGLSAAYDLALAAGAAAGSQLFVEVRNLTDEEARLATSVLRDFAPLPGRNVRFGVRLAF